MDNKNIRFFMSGFLAGASFIFLLIFIPVYRGRGDEIRAMKKFGNVTITPIEVDDKILFYTGESLVILKDEEPILTLYFDFNKQLKSLSFTHNKKPLFSASMSHDLDKWGMYSFGSYEFGIIYFDNNCDGMFDLYSIGNDRFIFLNKEWIKIDDIEKNGTAIAGCGNIKREFVFDKKNSWVEKTLEQRENLDPNDSPKQQK